MNQARGLGAMPNNKLVLHLVDEAVISFSWLEGGGELPWASVLRNPHRQVECQVLCASLRDLKGKPHTYVVLNQFRSKMGKGKVLKAVVAFLGKGQPIG